MKRPTWSQLYGAKRRAIDRALLVECEKQISAADLRDIELEVERQERARAAEALRGAQAAKNAQQPSAAFLEASERQRIAAAFGRQPLDKDK